MIGICAGSGETYGEEIYITEAEREKCRRVVGGAFSLAGNVIIFSITFPARFPGVRGWKTPVLKK